MRCLLCLLWLGLSAASLIAQSPVSPSASSTPHPPLVWQRIHNTNGDFSITIPENYKIASHTFSFQYELGSSVVYTDWRTVSSYWDGTIMVVDFKRVNQPEGAASQLSKDTAVNGAVQQKREVVNDSVKGREIVETKNGYTWRRQYFPLKGMVVMVMTISEKPDNPVANYFWDSLHIGPEAAKQLPPPNTPSLNWTATAQIDNTIVKTTQEVTRKAVILWRPEPPFPDKFRPVNIKLRVLLGADGQVQKIEPSKKLSEEFEAMAVITAQRINFIPAQFEGRNVSQWVQIEYSFSIH